MRDEERNEMLEADDKYESYRLGFKRGHDRGYEFGRRQDVAEINRITKVKDQHIRHSDRVTEEMRRMAKVINELEDAVITRGREILTLKADKGKLKEQLTLSQKTEAFAQEHIKEYIAEVRDLKIGCRAADVIISDLKQEVETLQTSYGVTESLLKIAHNDINKFLLSEDRMKGEIKMLKNSIYGKSPLGPFDSFFGRPF